MSVSLLWALRGIFSGLWKRQGRNGGQARNRTADASLFRASKFDSKTPMLDRLSI